MRTILLLILLAPCIFTLNAQSEDRFAWLEPADTFHNARFWTSIGSGAAIYTTASIGLYQAWYKDYGLTRFHTFDDMGEWNDMDKGGHLITAYIESYYSYKGLRWTGLDRKKSIWMAAGVGVLLQSTVEVMDGFSEEWGFSWADMGFNILGTTAFVAQETGWKEQRIIFKISSTPPDYPSTIIHPSGEGPSQTIAQRANDLYGSSWGEQILKDYNGQTLWASANVASFLKKDEVPWMPKWINIAVGYGAENMLGGFGNHWSSDDGYSYNVAENIYPRQRQIYLSLDADLSRIPTNKPWLKFVLGTLNWIKIPAPALEYNTGGKIVFHPIYW